MRTNIRNLRQSLSINGLQAVLDDRKQAILDLANSLGAELS